jgi:hypothetical protein
MILTWHWWLTTIILATHEAEIRRIAVLGQPEQIIHETLSQKKIIKKGWWISSTCMP